MKPKHVPSFNCFSSLSHLIHHSDQKYVVISYSNDPSDPLREHLPQLDHLPRPKGGSKFATFEVGEIGGSSRWWRGIWSLEDVKKIAGPGGNEEAHCNIIKNAAKQFIEGNLSITNLPQATKTDSSQSQSQTQTEETQLSTQPGSQLASSLVGPSLRIDSIIDPIPLLIPLSPLPAMQTLGRGNQLLFAIITEISLNHSARLFPSCIGEDEQEGGHDGTERFASSPGRAREDPDVRKKTAELQKQVEYLSNELKKHDHEVVVRPPATLPGRSLGNPTKKARKVQAVEFDNASSEEEKASRKIKRTKRA